MLLRLSVVTDVKAFSFACAVGIAAWASAPYCFPCAVLSFASSASISVAPSTPRLTAQISKCQRSSASIVSPLIDPFRISTISLPCSGVAADSANPRANAS